MVVAVLLGSVRTGRLGERVARWVVKQLQARGHEAVLVDAAELKLPLLDKMWKEIKEKTPPEYEELRGKLAPLAELYRRADGFVLVSAEYNHSVPPGLSNLVDHFLEEYFFRPSAIVCYSAGPYGGVRAAMQLRAMLCEAGMPSIPSLQAVPTAGKVLNEEGVATGKELDRAGKFFDEFEWYMRALKAERGRGLPY